VVKAFFCVRAFRRLLVGLAVLWSSAALAGDIQVSQYSFSPDPVPNSGSALFNIRLTNNGPTVVNDATLRIAISNRFRVDAGNFPAYCVLSGTIGVSQELNCTLPSLAVGNLNLTYTAVAITPGSSNTSATISSISAADPNPANDSLTITPAVVSGADLVTTKTDNLPGHAVAAGGTIAYQLGVSNGGPNPTNAVTLTDNLPPSSDLLFVSAAGTDWSCSNSGQTVSCLYGGAAIIGAYPPVTVTGQVVRATTGTITNNAFALLNSPLVGDPNGNNNAAPPVITTINGGTDLLALKTMPATIPLAAGAAASTVSIGVNNVGPQSVSDATVTDVLPNNLILDSGSTLPSGCSAAGQTVTCQTGPLSVGAQRNFEIKVRGAIAGVGLVNTATVTTPAGIVDPNSSNNSQSRTFQVQSPGADLTIVKVKTGVGLTNDPVAPGQDIVNTMRVINNGPSPLAYSSTNVLRVTEQLSADETYVSVAGPWTCTPVGTLVTCTRNGTGTLAVNNDLNLVLTTRAGPGANGTLSNTACTGGTAGSTSTPADPFAANDCVTASIQASNVSADLAINKTVSLSPGAGYVSNLDVPGTSNSIYIKLVATNLGLSGSTGVIVSDAVPGNYRQGGAFTTYAVVDAGGAVLSPGNVTISTDGAISWAVGALAVGAGNAQTLIIRMTRPFNPGTSLGALTNTATIKSTDIFDPVQTNNSSSATYTIHPVADVAVTSKTVSPNPTQVGVNSLYTISTRNLGPNFAEGVTLDDVIDTTRFDVVGVPTTTKGDGSCSVTNGVNTATIHCDLGIYQRNASFQVLQSVRPRYIEAQTYPYSYTNTATIATTSAETTLANNSGSVTHNVIAPSLDLSVTKQEPGPEFDPIAYGLPLTYDIRVSNFGPSRANNVVVIDTPAPPAGYTMSFLDFSVNQVAATSGLTLYAPPAPNCAIFQVTKVRCVLDSTSTAGNFLDPLRQTIFRVRFTPSGAAPTGPLTFTDSADVIASEQPTTTTVVADNQLANNTATQTTTVLPSADLEVVSKTRISPSPSLANTPIQYRIVIANNGVSPTTQVRVTDQLPAGFVLATPAPTFVASGGTTVSAMNCSGTTTVLCILDGLFPPDAGHASTVTITLYALASAPYSGPLNTDMTNTATISPGLDSGGVQLAADPIPGNNSKSATVQIAAVVNASIAGTVFADANVDNGIQAGEGLGGVTMTLQRSDGTPVATTVTIADGTFSFTGLPDGVYQLIETQPAGYFDGRETAGTSGGTVNNAAFGPTAATNSITTITLGAGVAATGYLFQELPPSTIAGTVFADANADNVVQAGEGLAGVTVTLTGTDLQNNPVAPQTVTTIAGGFYQFTGLPAGTYSIVETQPVAYSDGRETAGTAGGTVNNAAFGPTAATNTISAITLPAATNATGYLFQELSLTSLSGTVFADANIDNAIQAGEGLAGVTVTLSGTDLSNNPIAPVTTVTDAAGNYSFANLVPGTYVLVETQPTAYFDGRETAGTSGGTVNNTAFGAAASTNTISGITLAGGTAGTGYLFQELPAASVSGAIYRDLNNNGARDTGETGFAPAAFPSALQVRLTGTDYSGQAVDLSLSVDASGAYSFTNLPPSDATGYTVTELVEPTGTIDGLDRNGVGVLVAGSAGRTSPETIVVGAVAAGAALTNRDFGELPGATISGSIFFDPNANAVREPGETIGLAGGIIRLTGTDDLGQPVDCSVTTDASGNYSFPFAGATSAACRVLRPGTYTLTETPPAGFTHVGAFIGTAGGSSGGASGANTPAVGAGNVAITNIVITAGATPTRYDFAERGQGLSGYVYLDSNGNGVRDTGEAGIPGVVVTLSGTAANGQNVCTMIGCTMTTDAAGAYNFANVPGSDGTGYTLTEQSQATAPLSAYGDGADGAGTVGGATRGTAGNDVISGIVLGAGETGINYRFGERAGALAGFVYIDANDDGVRQAGETAIAGVTVTLSGTTLLGGDICALRAAATPALSCTVVTAADGSYSFGDVPAGTYSLIETQPAQYGDGRESAGTPAGTVNNASFGTSAATNGVTAIALGAGVSGTGYNFGERAFGISGRVYRDPQRDGVDGGEPGIAGVTIRLLQGGTLVATTTTAADGSYSFPGLTLGAYTVQEEQPLGYGSSTPDSVAVTLAGAAVTGINFGDTVSTLAGLVYFDGNNDGVRQAGERGISGVTVALTGSDAAGAPVSRTLITDANGAFLFGDLLSGSYTLTETQPTAYLDGIDSAGSAGGTISNDAISAILLGGGVDAVDYRFGELGQTLAGRVYVDTDLNGTRGPNDPGIAGVTITLQRPDGTVVATTTTAADGTYSFPNLDFADYVVVETQPAGYTDAAENPSNRVPVTVGAGAIAPINFGERGQSLGGVVYFDANLNGTRDQGEPGIGGVTVTLQRGDGSLVGTTTTAADGSYGFTGLPLGTYLVIETQPAGYTSAPENASNQASATIGAGTVAPVNFGERGPSLGGAVYLDNNLNGTRDTGEPGIGGVTITLQTTGGTATGVTTTAASDGTYQFPNVQPGAYVVVETQPAGYTDAPENSTNRATVTVIATGAPPTNFGERGLSLSGAVYLDTNRNGTHDTGETGIGNVTIALQRPDGTVVATTVTAADGSYTFLGLATGDYVVVETQPAGYGDAAENASNRATATVTGTASPIVNFGERIGSIAGLVYNDSNNNGRRDTTEPPLSGVTLTLTGTDANGAAVTQTAVTGSAGTFLFTGLVGGTYTIVETQPQGFNDGLDAPGTAGGTALPLGGDTISGIVLGAAQDATGYLFGERGPGATLSGSVWFDANHNRARDANEPGKGGWTVQLYQSGVLVATTVTDADGRYQIADLQPGSGYSLLFRDPVSGAAFGSARPNETGANASDGVMSPTNPAGAQFTTGQLVGLTLLPGANVAQQSLPLDPSGVVYDSVRRTVVPGATVRLTGPAGFDPVTQLLGGAINAAQTVGPDGIYQFLLLPGAPNGVYTLSVTPPAGGNYNAVTPSTVIPPCAGPLTVGSTPNPLLISTFNSAPPLTATASCAPGGGTTGYYLSFNLTAGISADAVNNNIPIDPILQGSLVVTKTTPMTHATRGGLVPYQITARNVVGGAVPNIAITDRIPAGFRYRSGSARLNGVAITPVENGRLLVFPAQNFAAAETKKIDLILTVGAGVGDGQHVNQAYAVNAGSGTVASNIAEAVVRIEPDADFDCSDVLGKVFDDKNGNGYEDEGEPGLAGVRVVTVAGDLITTDKDGRYHVTCPMIPDAERGSNFILKLDPRTLPSGYRMTTENPETVRLTPGKFVKLNFGAAVLRVVRLDLKDSVFSGEALAPDYATKVDALIETLDGQPSVLRIAYVAHGESKDVIRKRVTSLKKLIEWKWGAMKRRCRLIIEMEDGI
jgi:uncharacterized repeat protein (TIGR01451 family)